MNTESNSRSEFNFRECREALASFDQSAIEQAINVVTSKDVELISKAARDPDMGRVVFWVQEWMTVERIETKREAFARLWVIPSIRRQRRETGRSILAGLNAVLGFALVVGQSTFWILA